MRFATVVGIASVAAGCARTDSALEDVPERIARFHRQPTPDGSGQSGGEAEPIARTYTRHHGGKLEYDMTRSGSPVVGVKFGSAYGSTSEVTDASLHLMVNINRDRAQARRESVEFLDRYYGTGAIAASKIELGQWPQTVSAGHGFAEFMVSSPIVWRLIPRPRPAACAIASIVRATLPA